MKKLGFLNKIVFILNTCFATLLLGSYVLPYLFPKSFPSLSVLSLTVPVLITCNLLFLLYWALQLKKQFLLSFIILVLGYQHITAFYGISGNDKPIKAATFSVMSYNVRIFNKYEWIPKKGIDKKIVRFIEKEQPDILCFQEFLYEKEHLFDSYPYKYIRYKTKNQQTGQAIFSKYPIYNEGSLEFPSTGNNAIFVDIANGKDSLRIYNLHLESLRINTQEQVTKEESEKLFKSMGASFGLQQAQAEIFNAHRDQCELTKIVCGDFNNTQYSNIYKQVKGEMQDTFMEAGSGFGRTFNFKYFPVRIDFILVDESIEVNRHKNYSEQYSDHFPIAAYLTLKNK
ncbi:endonuclease/exonuclease/phosphatase family protein [Ascidiimonas sp. W6]|uniref:endonuclease/exonuclease/phosphatase family protein n=1 Tax=Ascidiimonas meishanensis TaxID=3128903 RepID=UPI0030EB68B5